MYTLYVYFIVICFMHYRLKILISREKGRGHVLTWRMSGKSSGKWFCLVSSVLVLATSAVYPHYQPLVIRDDQFKSEESHY